MVMLAALTQGLEQQARQGECLVSPEALTPFLGLMKIVNIKTEIIGQQNHDLLIVRLTGLCVPEGSCKAILSVAHDKNGAMVSVKFEPA